MRHWQIGLAAAALFIGAAANAPAQTLLSEAELDQVTAGIDLPFADLVPTGVPSVTGNLGSALLGASAQLRTASIQQARQGQTGNAVALASFSTLLRGLGRSF